MGFFVSPLVMQLLMQILTQIKKYFKIFIKVQALDFFEDTQKRLLFSFRPNFLCLPTDNTFAGEITQEVLSALMFVSGFPLCERIYLQDCNDFHPYTIFPMPTSSFWNSCLFSKNKQLLNSLLSKGKGYFFVMEQFCLLLFWQRIYS